MASDKTSKIRIDHLLVERKLAPSRTRAQALIMAGKVVVGDERVDKPGTRVPVDAALRVKGPDHPYVSRGGLKLAGGLDAFDIDPRGMVALDVGASTGGFTDCLLQRGALKVFALDVGRAQMHQKLRSDPRVKVMERFNARHLKSEDLGEPVDLAVFDLSFISVRLVLGPVRDCLRPSGQMVILVKPQFEVGREQVGRGGIVRDEALQLGAVDKVSAAAADLGLTEQGRVESPISGADGNREWLLHLFGQGRRSDCLNR